MSSLKPKRKRDVDVTAWVLVTTIVVLASLDLVVWAAMRNVPNPISKFIVEQSAWLAAPPERHASR